MLYRPYCIFLLFCILPILSNAQSDREALKKEYFRLMTIAQDAREDSLGLVLDLSKKMIGISRQLNDDTLLMQSNMMYGQALDFTGVFDAALKVYYENLTLARQKNNCYFIVKTAILVAYIHQGMFDWKQSSTFLKEAKQTTIACGMLEDTLSINYDIGHTMFKMGNTNGGISLVEHNLKVARQVQNQPAILLGIVTLSNLLAENQQFEQAMTVELEALEMPEELLDNLAKAQIYERLSEIAVELKQWDKAQIYQKEALKYAKMIQLNDWIYDCYRTQMAIDSARGDYKSALANFQRYASLKDSVYHDEYNAKMAAMIAVYDLESKQKTIELLEKDQQIKAAKIQEQRTLLLLGALLAVLIFLGIRFWNQRKTEKMRVLFAQDLIKAQEQERQRISKDLHDSVGQNILFIKNSLQRLVPEADAQLVNSVDSALEEVRSIAKDLYPNQLEVYGLSSAVDALCELAQQTSGIFISCDLQGIDERLNREAKINCYRIIQECINNTIKHAGATAIRITANLQHDNVELVVQDNGKGFDKKMLERKALRSFGMINMEERIKMLRGKFELETTANQGAKLTFSIPA